MTKCNQCEQERYQTFCFRCDEEDIIAYMDTLTDNVWEGNSFKQGEIDFLEFLKKNRPDIANKFPRLYEKLKVKNKSLKEGR